MTEYEIVSELAVRMAKVTTRGNIINGDSWKPLTLLYEQMVKRKEIEPLERLTIDLKRKYWNETTGSKCRRIWVAEALYVYDLITKENE